MLHGCVNCNSDLERKDTNGREELSSAWVGEVPPSMARHAQEPTEQSSDVLFKGCAGYMALKVFGSQRFSDFK